MSARSSASASLKPEMAEVLEVMRMMTWCGFTMTREAEEEPPAPAPPPTPPKMEEEVELTEKTSCGQNVANGTIANTNAGKKIWGKKKNLSCLEFISFLGNVQFLSPPLENVYLFSLRI